MPDYTLKVIGQAVIGRNISGLLLRDLLGFVAEGSRRALRLRVEGRSIASGSPPSWLTPGAAFSFQDFSPATSVLRLHAASVADAAPERFAQTSLFFNHHDSAVSLWLHSLKDVLNGKSDSEFFDEGLLDETENDLRKLFSHDVECIQVKNGDPDHQAISLVPDSIERVRSLRIQTPPSQRTRVAGRLDSMRHSDRRFTLLLPDGGSITGVAVGLDDQELAKRWGQQVVVSGLAVFRPSGGLLRVEADRVTPASEAELASWSEIPRPIHLENPARDFRKPQGMRSGINAVFGSWPGDETDEEFDLMVRELS